jgi:peptidoglycan/xylan/chitin deacetylase (PgdA/CDA1 family)
VALTFDDGPFIYTMELLELLAVNNVKATFFLVGNNVGKGQINRPASGYPSIVQRMLADGHHIGSHSWSHQDMNALSVEQRRQQVIKNEIAIASIIGAVPTYFRPPFARCNGDCYNELGALGYHVVRKYRAFVFD